MCGEVHEDVDAVLTHESHQTFVREAGRVAPFVPASADVLSVVKGLENGSLLRMSEVIAEATGIGASRIAALSGP